MHFLTVGLVASLICDVCLKDVGVCPLSAPRKHAQGLKTLILDARLGRWGGEQFLPLFQIAKSKNAQNLCEALSSSKNNLAFSIQDYTSKQIVSVV